MCVCVCVCAKTGILYAFSASGNSHPQLGMPLYITFFCTFLFKNGFKPDNMVTMDNLIIRIDYPL